MTWSNVGGKIQLANAIRNFSPKKSLILDVIRSYCSSGLNMLLSPYHLDVLCFSACFGRNELARVLEWVRPSKWIRCFFYHFCLLYVFCGWFCLLFGIFLSRFFISSFLLISLLIEKFIFRGNGLMQTIPKRMQKKLTKCEKAFYDCPMRHCRLLIFNS